MPEQTAQEALGARGTETGARAADRDDCPTCNEGFLSNSTTWSREVARELAQRNDLGPLTDGHWAIIEYVRDYYLEHGDGPPVVKIARHTGQSMKKICELFPCGVARGAYRLAGLPRPRGCF